MDTNFFLLLSFAVSTGTFGQRRDRVELKSKLKRKWASNYEENMKRRKGNKLLSHGKVPEKEPGQGGKGAR